jgi:hypothetical protein
MTERWRCAHGLTLSEHCDACEVENAREVLRRYGEPVDEARRVVDAAFRKHMDEAKKTEFKI